MTTGLGFVPIGVANLVPLIGVILWGWDLPSIIVMYWIETGVIGLVNVLRIRRSLALGRPTADSDGSVERQILRTGLPGGWLLPGTWLAAYGIFWTILGPFVVDIANGGFYEGASRTGWTGAATNVIVWGTVSLVGGQLMTYFLDYVVGQRSLTVTSLELLRDPFVRIFVILATIAGGGVGIAVIGSPVGFLAAMVAGKTAVEIWFARTAPPAGSPNQRPPGRPR